jgi:signal peptidase
LSKRKNKKNPIALICNIVGTILLVVLILGCLPLTVPKLVGYHIYTVISGSMEPEIPTGSLVYIKYADPVEVKEDEIIAFYSVMDTTSIITHRVVTNSTNMGQFITKGDANDQNDMEPIPYENYIGRVVLSVPVAGGIAQTVTTGPGRIAAICVIGIAIFLEIIASIIDNRTRRE